MGELRDKMDRDMLLKNLSDRTRKTYLACVRDYVRWIIRTCCLVTGGGLSADGCSGDTTLNS